MPVMLAKIATTKKNQTMTARQLMKAAYERKAIVLFGQVPGRIPAAFVVGMPFEYVMKRLKPAKIYKPKKHQLK